MFFFDWIRSLLAYFGFKKNAKLLIIGLDNAGKSTLLDRLGSGRMVQNPPTWQSRSRVLELDTISFTAYDLGGHPQVWRDYLPAIDGVVFMVDSADSDRFAEAKAELMSLLRDDIIPDAPIAILFNKTDLEAAVGEEFLATSLELGTHRTGKFVSSTYKAHLPRVKLPGRPCETFPCSVLKQAGYGVAFRWLAHYVE